jgi:hypothetical protein
VTRFIIARKLEALPTTSTLRRLVVDTRSSQFGSVVVGQELREEAPADFLLFLGHVQLMLDVLSWRVDFAFQSVAVLREEIDGLTANLALRLFPLWQTSQVDTALSVVVVAESVEE